MQKVNITQFAIYYLYYKDKLSNLTWSFAFITNKLHFLYNLNNLSIAFAYTIKPSLIIKKKELLKTSIYLLSKVF